MRAWGDLTTIDLRSAQGPVIDLVSPAETRGGGMGRIVESLAAAVEAKDSHTGRHLYRSTLLASACLQEVDPVLSMSEDITFGFMLHDLGKIGIPDQVLNKPGELSAAEWAVMKSHPEIGARIVAPIGFSQLTTDVILYHHERYDGLGYPFGISGTSIPLAARVFAVADAYDAMISERPYRSPLDKTTALQAISLAAGTRFDPEVVRAFISLTS